MTIREKYKVIFEIGQHIETNGKILLNNIKKDYCFNNGKEWDDIMCTILQIKCFTTNKPINSAIIIKPHFKDTWRDEVDEYFSNLEHKEMINAKNEQHLELSINEINRNHRLSIINLIIGILTLLFCILAFFRTYS